MPFADDAMKWTEFYVGHGLRVLPVWGVTKELACQCSKGSACDAIGKHPILNDWPRVATTDLGTMSRWRQQYPYANIGIATSSSFTVLDIDPRNGGQASFAELVADHGDDAFASPWRVRTGGGGQHIAFRSPPGTRSRSGVRPGIDIKAEGGFVVVPFSLHASGLPYAFEPALASLDLSTLLQLPPVLRGAVPATAVTVSAGKLGTGVRNDTLASVGGKLRERGAGQQEIEAALKSLNVIMCEPPLADAEIQRVASSISKYAAGVPPTISFIGADELVRTVSPQVEWVVPGLVAIGAVTELTGQPKEAGKSTLVRAMVAAMLAGGSFAGRPTMRASVVMLSEERDHTLSYAIAQQNIGSSQVRVLQRHRLGGTPSWPQIVEASVAEMKRIGARVLVVDTLSYWALGDSDENSASDALKAMEPLLKAAAEGIAIIVVRHMRKSGGETVTSARGSSAITGAVDIVCTLASHSAGSTFRALDATGRYRESVFRLVVELSAAGTYVAHGTGQQLAQQARLALENSIIGLLPKDEAAAVAEKDLLQLLANTSTPIGRTKLSELLKELVASRAIACKGRGANNDPRRYWSP